MGLVSDQTLLRSTGARRVPFDASPLALAQALIRCPSVTPEEGGALTFLGQVLGKAGFSVERPTFSEAGTPDIENLFAKIGHGRCLLFAGHTDVVPPGDAGAWRHGPFEGAVEDGMLYGRGAVDMKGGIACMLSATLAFLAERGPDFGGSIGFLITGDEEGPALNGTVKLLDWARSRGERFDHCLLGEPTNPSRLGETIKIGRRGSLTGRLTVHGRQGHVAYPHRAENPIPGMLRPRLGARCRAHRRRHRAFRRLESRVHDAGRRQPGHQRDPRGGEGGVQHPLQRGLERREPRRGNPAPAGGRRRQRGALQPRSPALEFAGLSSPGPTPSSIWSRRRWKRRQASRLRSRPPAVRRMPASSRMPAR